MNHPNLITTYRTAALQPGWNHYLQGDAETGLDFAVYRLNAGDRAAFTDAEREMAVLVVSGRGTMTVNGAHATFDRPDWKDHHPTTAHLCAGAALSVEAATDTELAVVQTGNPLPFPPNIYAAADVDVEHRGKGQLDDACYRLVKLVFDRTIAPENARLVIGEVVNFAGRWSSYPPHHHRQPEIYYYRFSPAHGYGHGELGDEVFKIRQHDLMKITGARDHSQTSAPGFDMYYLWAIRHGDDDPYTGFEYSPPYDTLLR